MKRPHLCSMATSTLGRLVVPNYGVLPARALNAVVRREGGQLSSQSLRQVLRRYHGVEVGEYSYGSLLVPGRADRGTVIGRYVSIGPDVRRIGAAHPLDELSLHPFLYNPALGLASESDDVVRTGCEIGHDSWIGAGVIILPGCKRIGIGAVIGAGSVVTSDVPDFGIAVGSPARVLRLRLDEPRRQRYLDARPWQFEPTEMVSIVREMQKRATEKM